MSISVIRSEFSSSSKKLRRARRLYAYIIFEAVIGDVEALIAAANRALNFGLYSQSTGLLQAVFSLRGYLEKLDLSCNRKYFWDKDWCEHVYGIRSYNDWQRAVKRWSSCQP